MSYMKPLFFSFNLQKNVSVSVCKKLKVGKRNRMRGISVHLSFDQVKTFFTLPLQQLEWPKAQGRGC